ncbi:unnamed protein product, partial [Scytosiphon promiscuus]
IVSFSISYGDGSEGYTGSVGGPHSHTYNDDGVFLALGTVTDSEGLTGTEALTVVVGEPFSLQMKPESGEWLVGDTIEFNLTKATEFTLPDSITWTSKIEHCTTDPCSGEIGCHLHSLQDVDTANDSMSGSVVPIAHPLPSQESTETQVIITAQLIFDTTVIDYDWPTSARSRDVVIASTPSGLAIYYGDETCEFTPCMTSFMSNYPASFEASVVQSTNFEVYEFIRWEVTYPDNSTEISQETSLNNVNIDVDGLTVRAEYRARNTTLSSDISPPTIIAVGGYYTRLAVEWTSVSQEGSDAVIAYATTPDHDSENYQSSKAVLSALSTSTELLVPADKANFTVFLRAYNSVNNTISAKSTAYVVSSLSTLNSSDSLCPEVIPSVMKEDDYSQTNLNASVLPGTVQAEDFDSGGEGVAYHDSNTYDEGGSNYREGEGVDLQRSTAGTIAVAWSEPGEWISYTVQHPGNKTIVQDVSVRYSTLGASNGIALALDLDYPSKCPLLREEDEQIIMLDSNLPETRSYFDWAWTQNYSVALAPGPHVVTLCFIGNAVVNVDLFKFVGSDCGDGVCQWADDVETCETCSQDCQECPSAFLTLAVPGEVQAEDFDLGGEGVGFHENECVSTPTKNCTAVRGMLSDYRNESFQEGLVELREAANTVSWGWTSVGEWLTYTIIVTATADYNITFRYASAATAQADIFLNAPTCDIHDDEDVFLGSLMMPGSGGEAGPFSRTAPLTIRLEVGQHNIRVCVATGGFTLDEMTFDLQSTGMCNDDGTCDVGDDEGCESCQQDCNCSQGDWFGSTMASVPGFVEAYTFDEGENGVAYYDDTDENLGLVGPRTGASVDLEAGGDGSFHVAYGIPGEWLKYTVYASESGFFSVRARYATMGNGTALSITVDDGTNGSCEDVLKSVVLFNASLPSTGGWDVWADTYPVQVALPRGPHVFKICILNVPGASDTNLKGFFMQV